MWGVGRLGGSVRCTSGHVTPASPPVQTGRKERSLCVRPPTITTTTTTARNSPRAPPSPASTPLSQWERCTRSGTIPLGVRPPAHALFGGRGKRRGRGGAEGSGSGVVRRGGSGGLGGVGWGFQVEAPPTTQALLPLVPPWTCGRRHILSQCFSTTAPRLTGAGVRCAVENHSVSFKWSEKYE